MLSVSMSAEKQSNIERDVRSDAARIYLRQDHRQVEDELGSHWECDEAFMVCEIGDCPTTEELAEDFEGWFDYAAQWQPGRQKSIRQLQADIEYVAAMTGVDLEG